MKSIRMSEIATGTQDVAKDVSKVNGASRGITSSSQQVLDSARELSQLAESLRTILVRFKL